MVETAETLLILEQYDDLIAGQKRDSRIATDNLEWNVDEFDGKTPSFSEWIVSCWSSKTYFIHFEKNFVKKHCYTFTKKDKAVYNEVVSLWAALSDAERNAYFWQGYVISYPPELYVQARKNLNTAKFRKQLAHRSTAEQRCVCGHKFNQHAAAGGACTIGGCACGAYDSNYGHARVAMGKPIANPVSGATTTQNTALILNRIDKNLLLQTIRNAIEAKEKQRATAAETWAQGHVGQDLHCEKVTLDFGASNRGCILHVVAGGTIDTWAKYQSVPVSIKKQIPVVDASKPVYSIGHMFGGEAA